MAFPAPLLRRPAAFLVPLFVAAGAHAALPAGITQGADRRGHHRIPARQRPHVLLFPDASKPTTTVNVTYEVGSAHENYGETGMAHLLEHLVFKGTPTRGNIMQELGKRGMQFNGSTARTAPTTSSRSPRPTRTSTGRCDGSGPDGQFVHPRSDLDSEMTVVRNEFESGENNPQHVLLGKMLSTAYQWHNYGHLPIGARSDIENVDIEPLQASTGSTTSRTTRC